MAENDKTVNTVLVVLGLLLVGIAGTYGYMLYTSDCNGDGVRDLFDRKGCGQGGKQVIPLVNVSIGGPGEGSGGVTGPASLTIESLEMDSIYSTGHPLAQKIYLLRPNTDFKEVVRVKVEGATIDSVEISFDLLPGVLNKAPGVAMHELGGEAPIVSSTASRQSLRPGTYTIELKGTTPSLRPGHDWYIPRITVVANGKEFVQNNWRGDEPTKPKWLTLAYPNDWTSLPDNSYFRLIDTSLGEGGLDLRFVSKTIGERPPAIIGRLLVTEITYPGKSREVVDITQMPLCKDAAFVSSVCLRSDATTEQVIFINTDSFASVQPSQAYLKIHAWDVNGNEIDLNADPTDTAARVNIDQAIVGVRSFEGTEYFSIFGANRLLLPFSMGSVNKHPESQWFSN